MKLVVAIVHPEDAGALVDALTDKEFRVTRLHSQGGFLKQSHATILAGVEEAQVDDVLATIRETCHARSQFINPMPPIMEPASSTCRIRSKSPSVARRSSSSTWRGTSGSNADHGGGR